MTIQTLTRAQLAEAIFTEIGFPRSDSARLVDELLEEMSATLVEGEAVRLSSFGSFHLRDKNERIGRNPKTGEEVPIKSRRVLVFRASHILKDKINRSLLGLKKKSSA